MKKIIGVYRNQKMHWVGDGFPVKNLFSYDQLGQVISPFLLLDYASPYHFEPSATLRGVGSHPHRGFETVTLAYQGEVTHKDSFGGGGTIKTGDVQWMTAGAGLMHEEFHSSEFSQKGGLFEMVQLWINLPAIHKMTTPRYQAIETQDIPIVHFKDEAGQVRVIAGNYADQQGVAQTFSPINMWDFTLKADHTQQIQVPKDHNTLIIVLQGQLKLNQTQLVQDHSVVLFAKDDETEIQIQAVTDAQFLILTGESLNEPIQGYGPFVMNSKEEIMQAFHDFNHGKFGEIAI